MTLAFRPRFVLAAVAAAVTGVALAQPATGAPVTTKPQGVVKQFRHDAAARAAIAHQGAHQRAQQEDEDSDAGLEPLARDEQEAAISAAPGRGAPSSALAGAQRAAAALPVVGGTWRAVTDKPFLNDPVPGRGPNSPWDNYGTGWGLVSGRMTALTSSGNAVYAGAADGGVWRSTDRGTHWRLWSSGLPRYSIGALATNPADGSVWVGLGEANTNADAANGMGIWRLAPGGQRWRRVGGPEMASRNTFEIRFIGGGAFAATSTGLYRHVWTGFAGAWQTALKPDPNPTHSPYRTSQVTDVAAVPGSGGRTVLANLGWRGGTLPSDTTYNGFYVSTAAGAPGTFRRVRPTGDINPAEIGRVTFSAAASGRRLYAVVEDSASVSLLGQGVFVSASGNPAGPWRRIADPASLQRSGSAMDPPPDGYFPGIAGWYNQYVQVDPRDPMHVYLGLEEVFETRDGGRSWSAIGAYWNIGINCATTYYVCPPTTHPDQHAITLVGDQVYVGNDGGLWRRSRADHGRPGWINLNRSLHTLQYYSVAIGRSGDGDLQWGGLQDNGETLNSARMPALWQVFTGDGGDTIVDPRNGARAVVEYVYNDMALTTDAGRTYREISPSCTGASDPPGLCDPDPLFIAPIETDVHNAARWVTAGQYVWVSTKAWNTVCAASVGCDWRPVYRFAAGSSVSAVAMSGSTIYAASCSPAPSCNPGLSEPFGSDVVTNAGGRWHAIGSGLPNRYITSLTVDPADAAHVYATLGAYSRRWIPGGGLGHVFESTDSGRHWRDISANLPDAPVLKLALWQGRLVVGGDAGVFAAPAATAAGPATWSRLGGGLPPVRNWDLAVTPDGGNLVTATHGRGMWELAG